MTIILSIYLHPHVLPIRAQVDPAVLVGAQERVISQGVQQLEDNYGSGEYMWAKSDCRVYSGNYSG